MLVTWRSWFNSWCWWKQEVPLGRTWRAGEQRAAMMEFCIQTAKQ